MDKFEYASIGRKSNPNDPNQIVWIAVPPIVPPSSNPFDLLNALGRMGWEAVAIGDLGGTPHSEILLKRRIA